MTPEELLPFVEGVVSHLEHDEVLPSCSLLLAGDGAGKVRPHLGVFLKEPSPGNSSIDTSGRLYSLPFEVHLVVLPAPSATKRDALVAALVMAKRAMLSLRHAHLFDDLVLDNTEPISIMNLTPSETVLVVNYACNIVI